MAVGAAGACVGAGGGVGATLLSTDLVAIADAVLAITVLPTSEAATLPMVAITFVAKGAITG